MKVLFFISTLENDGAERAMSNITTHLPKEMKADILLNSISENDFPTDARKISLGMKPNAKKGLFYQLKAFCIRVPKLIKLKRENHYDACISFMESANICNILTGNKYCKTIVSVRVSVEHDESWKYKYIVRPLVRIFYKKADRVVAVAEGVRKGLIEYFNLAANKVTTITNGYDVSLIHRQMNEQCEVDIKQNEEEFVFVTVGRLSFQKAQWHLVRAFSEVVKKCPNAKLLIVGQGEDKEYLLQLIESYNLEDKINILPYQKNPFSVLDDCDVYVMPSMFEGYCNALCEALICGLPCIATDFQTSAREILAPDTSIEVINIDSIEYAKYGVLVPVCSGKRYQGIECLEMQEELLARAMVEMYRDTKLQERYKIAAKERGKQLDINEKVKEWINLL